MIQVGKDLYWGCLSGVRHPPLVHTCHRGADTQGCPLGVCPQSFLHCGGGDQGLSLWCLSIIIVYVFVLVDNI
jgi:hypothetical protein